MVKLLIEAVKKTAAAIVPGAPEMVAAGEALFNYVKSIAPTLSEPDQLELQAALPALLTKMNRNVDQAMKDLRG